MNLMLRIIFNKAYKKIKFIRNQSKLKINRLNFKKYEFNLLNFLCKLKIQHQILYDQNLDRLKHRHVYVFLLY